MYCGQWLIARQPCCKLAGAYLRLAMCGECSPLQPTGVSKNAGLPLLLPVQCPCAHARLYLTCVRAHAPIFLCAPLHIMQEAEKSNCAALLAFVSLLWATEAIPLFATALLIPPLVTVLRVLVSAGSLETVLRVLCVGGC